MPNDRTFFGQIIQLVLKIVWFAQENSLVTHHWCSWSSSKWQITLDSPNMKWESHFMFGEFNPREQQTPTAMKLWENGHWDKMAAKPLQWLGAQNPHICALWSTETHSHNMCTFEALPPLVDAPGTLLLLDCVVGVLCPFSMSTNEPLSTDERTVDTQHLAWDSK